MPNEQLNGTVPDVAQATAMLQTAVDAFGVALIQSKTVGAQMNINVAEMLVHLEVARVQMGLLLEVMAQIGALDQAAWKTGLAQRFDQMTARLNQPRIAIATGIVRKGN